MPFPDLRSFIDGAQRIGELKVIDGADWNPNSAVSPS